MTVAELMLDHPGWFTEDRTAYRVVRSGDSVWAVTCSRSVLVDREVTTTLVSGRGVAPRVDVFDPAKLRGKHPVTRVLRENGPVARLRNPDVWDALATSIVRQVIRAGQARKLYRAFCREYGEQVMTAAGAAWLFPTPQTVLALRPEQFKELGMAFKSRPLQAAAQAYLDSSAMWADLGPVDLVSAVQHVHRIGPWSAGATVADLSNDYTFYPCGDLAVRTWVKRLAPELEWPAAEPEFARAWQAAAGTQLSAWTLLTLAFGVRHANAGAV